LELLLASLVKPQEELLQLAASGGHNGQSKKGKLTEATAEAGDTSVIEQGEEDEEFDEEGLPLMPEAPLLRNVAEGSSSPSSSITSLRLENCGLKSSSSLEIIANSIRFSTLKHISLRRNRIGMASCAPLSNILKDYPDSYGSAADQAANFINGERPLGMNGSSSPSQLGRYRATSPTLPEGPLIISSPAGGMTSRRMPQALAVQDNETSEVDQSASLSAVADSAFSQAKKAKQMLAQVPRMGSLLTLDLKSNDIRVRHYFFTLAIRQC
jgi:protein phosphatase 1 regulatory subunit 37